MSTVAIYNGFGQYESRGREKGITLKYGGNDFWFPFQKVAYLPDYTLREVDHAASSTGGTGEESVLTYKTFRVSGQRLAEELLETQDLYKNSDKGIIVIDQSDKKKLKGDSIMIFAGIDEEGRELTTEVWEVMPSQAEKDRAETLASAFKNRCIQEYFQAKRERMSGGQGPIFPIGNIKLYMDELGVKDIDDVARQTGTTGVSELVELLRQALNRPEAKPEEKQAVKQAINDLV